MLCGGIATAGSITVELTPREFREHRVVHDRAPAKVRDYGWRDPAVRVAQFGDNNTAQVDTTAGHSALILQRGDDHAASVSQTATGQGALVIQTGIGAATDITQTIDGEKVVILQHSWAPRR